MTNIFRLPFALSGAIILIVLLISGCGGFEGDTEGDVEDDLGSDYPGILKLTSPAFVDGGPIPSRYTCDGTTSNPELTISGVPSGTNKLVLFLDDLDGGMDGKTVGWNHWVVFNIRVGDSIEASSVPSHSIQGTNDSGNQEYGPPCPPGEPVRKKHRYQFTLYATNTDFDSGLKNSRTDLVKAMKDSIMDKATLTGTYGEEN